MADKAAAGRKPWRCYYVMAFPLDSTSLTQDKLQEMTNMTKGIEQREEKYLHKVVKRNAAHAAVVENERRAADKETENLSLALHVAKALRRLYTISVLLLVVLAVVFALYVKDDLGEHVSLSLTKAATLSVAVALVVDIGGWLTAWRCNVRGARVLLILSLAQIVGLVLLLDEVNLVQGSHNMLQEVLPQSQDALTQHAINVILNGGTEPSLMQRFVFDAPSEFLRWLSVHCANSTTTKFKHESVAIDQREFFTSLWDENEEACVGTTVNSYIQLDKIVQAILGAQLIMVLLQALLTSLFVAVSDTLTVKKMSKIKTKPSLQETGTASTRLAKLLVFGTALFGSFNVIASMDMLLFCSITEFHEVFTWIVVACLLSGVSALLAALFLICGWKHGVASVVLVLSIAAEVFALAESGTASQIKSNVITETRQTQLDQLRDVYKVASSQTCSSIKRWISHVCVGMKADESSADFNESCQQEFTALLFASSSFANSYLAWSIGVKFLLLVQLLLPLFHATIANVTSLACFQSPSKELPIKREQSAKQQVLRPLDYDKALDVYLTSVKVKDPTRIAAERKAFEKEWSFRTGRALSDVRTPLVVVTATNFAAIVRTLILRRLSAICKLDVSLSVSNDGHLLLVRIFASDNLLLTTLCDTATYRLQFADAIDPGRTFWCDRKEVNADHKVLDASVINHKLKVLRAEKVISSKEAVWFPGESQAHVSARIHALSRIVRASRGFIHCHNPAPAFASYSPSSQHQFIYKTYPNKLDNHHTYRRAAVMRTIDCIRFTRRIIDSDIDINAALENGLITSFHCLHSSSRFDWNSREALASSWIAFWKPVYLPGEFRSQDHAVLNLVGRIAPFRQPLQDVRDNFGELIAFYFAWLAFYGKMLALPAIAALVAVVMQTQPSPQSSQFDETNELEHIDKTGATIALSKLILGAGMIAWSLTLVKMWERKSVWYSLQWGIATDTADSGLTSCDAEFKEQDAVLEQSVCSEFVSLQWRLQSWLLLMSLGGTNALVVLTLLLSQGVLADIWGTKLAVLGSCVCHAMWVQWNSKHIPSIAHALTWWENSRSSAKQSTSVVGKMFTLELFNTFTGLALLMLSNVSESSPLVSLVPPLDSLYASYKIHIESHVGVLVQIETLSFTLIATRLSVRVCHLLSLLRRFGTGAQRFHKAGHEEETMLSPYPGPHKDYAQLVVQLGFVVTLSMVCPVLPLLAMIDSAAKLRQGALELCCIRQRPEPKGVETQQEDGYDIGLGPWIPYILIMLKLSVALVLLLVLFTADNYQSTSIERRMGWWLAGMFGIWAAARLLWFVVPRETREVEEARARNAHLVERYFSCTENHEKKTSAANGTRGKCHQNDHQDSLSGVKQSLHHNEERLELLQRLNTVVRKPQEPPFASSLTSVVPVTSKEKVTEERAAGEGRTDSTESKDVEATDEARQLISEGYEAMIGDDFPPLQGVDDSAVKEPSRQASRLGTVCLETHFHSQTKSSSRRYEEVAGSRVEENVERPASTGLWKLFKQGPDAASSNDVADSSSTSPSDTHEPEISAPSQLASRGSAGLLNNNLLKEMNESSALASSHQVSPSHSNDSSNREASTKAGEGSKPSRTELVPKQFAPRRLSTLFRRVQPPSAESAPLSEPSPVSETMDRRMDPMAALRDQSSSFSDTERTDMKAPPGTQSQRPSSNKKRPVYTKIDLSGLEAVCEAASRQQFDFSVDEQGKQTYNFNVFVQSNSVTKCACVMYSCGNLSVEEAKACKKLAKTCLVSAETLAAEEMPRESL